MMSLTMMAAALTTLPKWAKSRQPPIPMSTINKWKERFDDFPEPAEIITPTMHRYRESDLERFLKRHPTIGHGRRRPV